MFGDQTFLMNKVKEKKKIAIIIVIITTVINHVLFVKIVIYYGAKKLIKNFLKLVALLLSCSECERYKVMM